MLAGALVVWGTVPFWRTVPDAMHARGLEDCLQANVDRDAVFRWAMALESRPERWVVAQEMPEVFGRMPRRTFDKVGVQQLQGGVKQITVGWGGRDWAWGTIIELIPVQSGKTTLTNLTMRAMGPPEENHSAK